MNLPKGFALVKKPLTLALSPSDGAREAAPSIVSFHMWLT